jgi:hypothetical protein
MTDMFSEGADLPVEVESEVGALIADLREAGWTVSASRYDARVFGNWYVDLRRKNQTIRLMKDRSQYTIGGPPIEEIKAAGLRRSFDNLYEFQQAIVRWTTNPDESIGNTNPSN